MSGLGVEWGFFDGVGGGSAYKLVILKLFISIECTEYLG